MPSLPWAMSIPTPFSAVAGGYSAFGMTVVAFDRTRTFTTDTDTVDIEETIGLFT